MLKNPFHKEFTSNIDLTININDKTFPYSPYFLVNEFGLAFGANVDLKVIEQSFNQITPFLNELIPFTNDFCLSCIHAYDLSGNYELLELADTIYQKHSKYSSIDEPLIFINTLQIKYRYNGKVEQQDINNLIQFKRKNLSDDEALFCANVLLGSKEESKFHFNELEVTLQDDYKDLPIYTLYQKLVQE